jgi:hypothetical protein
VGAGVVSWALAVGAGGMGLGLGSLAHAFRTGSPRPDEMPGELGTWLESWVLLCASAYVWVQVVAGDSTAIGWWQLAVVLVGCVGGWVVVLLHARSLGGPGRD